MIEPTIRWFHETLGHGGVNRLYDAIRQHFFVPRLRQLCDNYRCEICRNNKVLSPGYGHLPPREAPLMLWAEVMIDLIGPWKVAIDGEDDIYIYIQFQI